MVSWFNILLYTFNLHRYSAVLKGFGVRDVTQGELTAPTAAVGAATAASAAAPLAPYGAVRIPRRPPAAAAAGAVSMASSRATGAGATSGGDVATTSVTLGGAVHVEYI